MNWVLVIGQNQLILKLDHSSRAFQIFPAKPYIYILTVTVVNKHHVKTMASVGKSWLNVKYHFLHRITHEKHYIYIKYCSRSSQNSMF